jgi:site-specific DNA-cytosine methylase
VDTTKELPTVIAFCAGYGGIERGLDLAGLEHRVIAYVEIEAFAIANLVNKMENGLIPPAPIYTDLKTFPAHLFRDRVDLITGGYPCQPFSAAGQRKGADDPRHLWPFIRRHIDSIRPLRCFFENVEGHISLGLREVIDDLEGAGYSATWGIFSAAEVGAPHQRKRVYIMANSISAGVWDNDRPPANEGRSAAQFGRADVRQGDREERSVRPESAGSSSADMGNSEHYGSSTSEIRGGASSTSNNTTQGQNEASKSQRASQPDCGGDLSGAADMGHSQNNRCAGCRETIKRERSENHIKRPDQDLRWQSQRSSQTLANSDNSGQQPIGRAISEPEVRDNAWRGGEELADRGEVSNTRNNRVSIRHVEPSKQGQQRQTSNAYTSCSTLSDTISERLEGHSGHGKDCNQSRWIGEKEKRPVGKGSLCNGEPNLWPPEPRLGRVVDGCADRVDRIRMLGNGVVPQTAAKAWGILIKRLN